MRATKLGLEQRIGKQIPTQAPILELASEHSANMMSRYKVGSDGKTAYRRLKGRECTQIMIEFGEQVLAKPKRAPKSRRKQSIKSRWVSGTWVGHPEFKGASCSIAWRWSHDQGANSKAKDGIRKME